MSQQIRLGYDTDAHPDLKPMTRMLAKQKEQADEARRQWYEKMKQILEEQKKFRPRVEEADDAPDRYLINVFYHGFLMMNENHIGVYYNVEKTSYWIGLKDPPIFYMFDQIVIEEYSKYVPKQSTEDRWNKFLRIYNSRIVGDVKSKHFSYHAVFRTLWEKGYIQEVCKNMSVLDTSVEAAAKKYLKDTAEVVDKKTLKNDNEKWENWVARTAELVMSKHALPHIEGAWVLTDVFMKKVKEEKTLKFHV